MPGEDGRDVMDGEIKIYDAIIMFANSTDAWKEKTARMFIFVESVDTVYNAGIAQGSTSLLAPENREYGLFGGV